MAKTIKKPGRVKPANAKTPKPAAKGKAPKPAKAAPKSSAPRRRRGIEGEQQGIPGTEQQRSTVLEREWKRRCEAAAARKSAAEDFAQAEANIQAEFLRIAEADPEDPRATVYRVDSGDLLRPFKKPQLKVTRKPSREAKAEAKARAANAATAFEPDDPAADADPVPDLPDPDAEQAEEDEDEDEDEAAEDDGEAAGAAH